MEKAHRIGNKLIWANGNILNDEVEATSDAKRFFAVVVMCGHVGDGFFVPILFPVKAKDMESAKVLVKNFPRVKNQIKSCILAMKEISRAEDFLIRNINLHDPYIIYSRDNAFMFARKIMAPDRLQIEVDKLRHKPKSKQLDLDEAEVYIKEGKDYQEKYVLQRYFAPRKQGGKIVYPKNVDMDLLLNDYFAERTRALGINRKVVSILAGYYKIFGADNQFGISVSGDKISFVADDGQKYDLDLDSFSLALMDLEDDTRLVDALKAKTKKPKENFDGLAGHARTGMERFKTKWQKTQALQGRNGKE